MRSAPIRRSNRLSAMSIRRPRSCRTELSPSRRSTNQGLRRSASITRWSGSGARRSCGRRHWGGSRARRRRPRRQPACPGGPGPSHGHERDEGTSTRRRAERRHGSSAGHPPLGPFHITAMVGGSGRGAPLWAADRAELGSGNAGAGALTRSRMGERMRPDWTGPRRPERHGRAPVLTWHRPGADPAQARRRSAAMARTLGVAVIGYGWMGRVHAQATTRACRTTTRSSVRARAWCPSPTRSPVEPPRPPSSSASTGPRLARPAHRPGDRRHQRDHAELPPTVRSASRSRGGQAPVDREAGGPALADAQAVADAAHRGGLATQVGFNYRNAPGGPGRPGDDRRRRDRRRDARAGAALQRLCGPPRRRAHLAVRAGAWRRRGARRSRLARRRPWPATFSARSTPSSPTWRSSSPSGLALRRHRGPSGPAAASAGRSRTRTMSAPWSGSLPVPAGCRGLPGQRRSPEQLRRRGLRDLGHARLGLPPDG